MICYKKSCALPQKTLCFVKKTLCFFTTTLCFDTFNPLFYHKTLCFVTTTLCFDTFNPLFYHKKPSVLFVTKTLSFLTKNPCVLTQKTLCFVTYISMTDSLWWVGDGGWREGGRGVGCAPKTPFRAHLLLKSIGSKVVNHSFKKLSFLYKLRDVFKFILAEESSIQNK